jgi:hypothetical protein
VEGYGQLPLAFEANQGQSDSQVNYLSRGAGYTLFLTSNEAVLALHNASRREAALPGAKVPMSRVEASRPRKSAVLRMKLVGSNAKTQVSGQDELPGKSNYFIGNDPKKWRTDVRQFAKVLYKEIYPGVDLVYYGHQRELEYDFVVQPGADPQAIRLGLRGAKRLRLEHGDLVLTSAGGDVRLRSPQIYQEANGVRQEVRGGYVIKGRNEAGFRVAAYDQRRALVIDPVLAYSTYLGGSVYADGLAIAVDSKGNAYVTGNTSNDFPVANPIQPTNHGGSDAFVTKINADGTALVYSTYLGGTSSENGQGIAVDTAGNAYVTGSTQSTDFPTANAFQATLSGFGDAFVTKINANGTALLYSTYLGGSGFEWGNGIAVDAADNAYVTGYTTSTDFPVANAIEPKAPGQGNSFVTKINADGSAFIYSTYLGGSDNDSGSGIAADRAGNTYVTGWTDSTDFPTVNALQPTSHGGSDAFVTKINANGTAFVYSTYLGGAGADSAQGIAVDAEGNTYVTGYTWSVDFPMVNAIQSTFAGGTWDGFVTEINPGGSGLVYSTYLGGSGDDLSLGIAVDTAGNAYVAGQTVSTDFPIVNAIQPTKRGVEDVFVTKISSGGSAFVYSTYLGGASHDFGYGIAADAAGSAYVIGYTSSKNFPKTVLAFQQSLTGTYDAFVSKIASQTFLSISPPKSLSFLTQLIGTTSAAKKVTMTNNGSGTLRINKIYMAGLNPSDFGETNNCVGTLASNTSCTISVTFTPTDKNKRQALMAISDSDPTSPQSIALSGNGTVVSLSKTSLSFGNQQVGTSSGPQSVTLTNTGSTQMYFFGISITGTNPGDFSETNTCGTSIAAKASCTITATFRPTATGTRKAAVSISDDGGGSPQKVTLTGTGT